MAEATITDAFALAVADEITALRAEVIQLRKIVGDNLFAQGLTTRSAQQTQDALIDLLRGEKSREAIAEKLAADIADRRVAERDALTKVRDRAIAIHEAGHVVVAHALGAEVSWVEIDLATGTGETRFNPFDDAVEDIAVTLAGYLAEVLTRRSARLVLSDLTSIRQVLSRLPESERSAVHAEGFRLAEAILKARLDVVYRIADELLTRKWSANSTVVCIDGDELEALLR